jgi:hypothetical protein
MINDLNYQFSSLEKIEYHNFRKHLKDQGLLILTSKHDSSIFGTDKNVLLGNIYIPPENTKYSCLDAFNEIKSEMFQLSEHSDLIGLLGDINAKTKMYLGIQVNVQNFF